MKFALWKQGGHLLMTWVILLALGWLGSTGTPTTSPAWAKEPPLQSTLATLWGRNQYIEYIPGTLPIIIAAPHGGYLKPDEIPDRRRGIMGIDGHSQEYTRWVADEIERLTGHRPHVIINHLSRDKLDANRGLREAAQRHWAAEIAWHEFHNFIEQAKQASIDQCGRGHFFDLHTSGHPLPRVEINVILSKSDLAKDDSYLHQLAFKSSLRSLAKSYPLAVLLRGPNSLGSLLSQQGYPSVPSELIPHPQREELYFGSGYNTKEHGSRDGGQIDASQVETHYHYVRDKAYATALAWAIIVFMDEFYQMSACVPFPSLRPGSQSMYLPHISKN